MGSHLFNGMPRTGGYRRVIALLGRSAGGGEAAGVEVGTLDEVASATLDAAIKGLSMARGDEGLAYTWFMMVNVVRASKESALLPALDAVGVPTPATISGLPDIPPVRDLNGYSVYDLTCGFAAAVDRRLCKDRTRTDISEIGQLAAAECLSHTVTDWTLMGGGVWSVQKHLQSCATERGFGGLSTDFFAKLIRRFLEYHLSRELSNHVGPNRRFRHVDDHNEFLRQLDYHCHTCAQVIRPFAGQWLRKRLRLNDHSVTKSHGFIAHALDLLGGALAYQEGDHV